jgi:crossover junction endodeoxyribonuclease RuvC
MIRPLRMVALDLSTAATGVASTHDPYGQPFLSVFTVPGTAKRPLHEQIALIKRAVRRTCGLGSARTNPDAPDLPDLVVIEGTFSRASGPGQDYPLHALHACIKQALWDRKIPYVDVSNGTVKMWATGTGATSGPNKVTKDKVVAAIIANYGKTITINPADDNQCDAVALLTLGMEKYGQPIGPYVSDKPRRRAFKNVAWPGLGTEAA